MKILIVDDSAEQRQLLTRTLQGAGYDSLVPCSSALEALDYLGITDKTRKEQPPDLILLDIVMPRMDGLQTLKILKSSEHHADIPVIIVTASDDVSVIEQAFEADAADYIAKPFRKVELLARLRSALRLKRESDRRKIREAQLLKITSQLETAVRSLAGLSSLDVLTGLPNRAYFDDLLEQEWVRSGRSGRSLAVILGDLDHFKAYNETEGPQAGDERLRQIGKLMSSSVRSPDDVAARHGFERFILMLPATDEAAAAEIAEGIRRRVESLGISNPGARSDHKRLTISFGVAAALPTAEEPAAEILKAADQALFRAKRQGRNRVGRASAGG